MSGRARRVAFITNTPLLEYPAGLHSPLASVRREILIPARLLATRGVTTHVISLPLWPAGQVDAIVNKADRIIFGKLLMRDDETPETAYRANAQAYRAVLAQVPAPASNIFCFADDHFDAPEFARFYRDAAPASAAWIASSEALQAVLRDKAPCPLYVYPEVPEGPGGAPRVPRRGRSVGLAVAAARRLGIGLDPWRLRLLWFGHPSNVPSLLDAIAELRALAQEIPLRLECVTVPGGPLEALTRRQPGTVSEDMKIVVRPWSLDYLPVALHDCHAVILPQHAHDPKKRAKSNNRLVDALNAGRFVVAHPIPSYQDLKDFAWVGDSIAEGLRWLLAHPAQALRRVVAGQEHLARHHSLDALGEFWLCALEIKKAS